MSVGFPTRRPGGRTAEVSQRVNGAVLQLLTEGGVAACTFAAVAQLAGVERSTLYRRFGDRWAMMTEAMIAFAGEQRPTTSLGSLREDLRLLACRTAEVLGGRLGPAAWSLTAAIRAGSAPELRGAYWRSRVGQVLPIIDAAKARGELSPDVDAEELLSFVLGAVHFRMFVIGQTLTAESIDAIVGRVCQTYCRRAASVEMQPTVAPAEVK